MAEITDLPTLITEVKSWINDSGTSDETVKGWIQLAESRFRRKLAKLDNEVTVTSVPSSELDALPSMYNGMREAYVVGSPNRPLTLITPAQMTRHGDLTGEGVFFSIEAGNFRFNPSISGATFSLTYFMGIPALTDGDPTNYLVINYPDVYLAGTLTVAQKFLRDDVDAQQFKLITDEWFDEMSDQDFRRKWAGQKKRVGQNPALGNLR